MVRIDANVINNESSQKKQQRQRESIRLRMANALIIAEEAWALACRPKVLKTTSNDLGHIAIAVLATKICDLIEMQ